MKKIVGALATFCGITGITVCSLFGSKIEAVFHKDWTVIAEQYNNDALELYDSGKYEEAIKLYNKAIELEDKNIEGIETCYYNRGRAYYKQGNYLKAIGDYTKAIEISPKGKYYSERAMAYEAAGDSANAMLDNMQAALSIRE